MTHVSQVNILLVDDKQPNLLALEAILDRPDYNLIKAASGKEALLLLLREDFAVVLLDVMMPEMDGFAVASAMKERERTRRIPIIFVTAIAKDAKDIYRGYAAGGVDYVQKPLDPDVVRAKVSVFVELFRQRHEIERQAELIRNSERAQFLEREQEARRRAEAAEQRYYDLINWVDHAVLWEYDPIAERFAFVSMRSLEILGYSNEQWVNDPRFFYEHIAPEDQTVFEDMLKLACEQGQSGRCEHRFYRPNGETLWVHSGVNPRKDAQGRVTLLWGLTLDITGAKVSEFNQRFIIQASRLLSSSLDYETTLERVAHFVVPALADWCVVDILNPAGDLKRIAVAHHSESEELRFRELLQKYSPKPGQKTPILDVVRTGEPVLWHSVDDARLVAGAQDEEQLRFLREMKMYSVLFVPLKKGEMVLGVISLVSSNPHRRFNETDMNFAEELASHMALAIENSRLYSEAQKAIALREEVLGIVSHDLKGPLSAISLCAQTLAKPGKVDPALVAARIDRSVVKMNALISDLLDMSKIEAGHLIIEKKAQPAQSLIREAVEACAPVASTREITLLPEMPQDPILVLGDHDRILQVFSNLIGNALKFTPDHGRITVGMKRTEHEVQFWITDTGPGISKEDLPSLFERFWQSAEGRKVKGSTGLGLYIAKEMIEAHQGRIWVESLVGSGSTFYFTLPCSTAPSVGQAGAA